MTDKVKEVSTEVPESDLKSVDSLMVGGFRARTYKKAQLEFVDDLPTSLYHELEGAFAGEMTVPLSGYVSLHSEARAILGVIKGEIVRVASGESEADDYAARILPGRKGVVSITSSLRSQLGVTKFEGHDGEHVEGSVVNVYRDVDGVLRIVRSEFAREIGEYMAVPRKP